MVAVLKKYSWLSGVFLRRGTVLECNCDGDEFGGAEVSTNQTNLEILAFEAARIMSRLVSLHRYLSDSEIMELRSRTTRSEGVGYLNSTDQQFLLRIAAAEMVDELDRAAEAVSRLACRGRMPWRREFHHIYEDLKQGAAPCRGFGSRLGLGFHPKEVEKKMRKLEKYIATTYDLHEEMEILAEMEASERKLERWKNYSGPITPTNGQPVANPPGAESFLKKLALQRQNVKRIQQESLWGKGYCEVIGMMGKATITIFVKICSIFSHAVSDLPVVVFGSDGRIRFGPNCQYPRTKVHPNYYSSGPLDRPPVSSDVFMRNSGPLLSTQRETKPWAAETLKPGASTVGSAGLATRYAEIIKTAEEMLSAPESVGEEARTELYRKLPSGIRAAVRTKLRKKMGNCGPSDEMAEGWRVPAKSILEWLGPMARDTTTWQSERSCEKRRFDPTVVESRKVLMLQTLFFSDKEKTDAAIVEVLVGLSCVCRCANGNCNNPNPDPDPLVNRTVPIERWG